MNNSILRDICDRWTRKLEPMVNLVLYFVFIRLSVENAVSHTQAVSKGNKIEIAFCENNEYLSSTLNKNRERAVWLKPITQLSFRWQFGKLFLVLR